MRFLNCKRKRMMSCYFHLQYNFPWMNNLQLFNDNRERLENDKC